MAILYPRTKGMLRMSTRARVHSRGLPLRKCPPMEATRPFCSESTALSFMVTASMRASTPMALLTMGSAPVGGCSTCMKPVWLVYGMDVTVLCHRCALV